MTIPPYKQRQAHYQSRYWQDLRAAARIRAGGQCEREVPVDDLPEGGNIYQRREASTNLQLHHLHYDTFGHETLDDVLLVCDRCHKSLEVMELTCSRCDNSLFDNESDAMYFIENSEWYKTVLGTGLHSAALKDAGFLCDRERPGDGCLDHLGAVASHAFQLCGQIVQQQQQAAAAKIQPADEAAEAVVAEAAAALGGMLRTDRCWNDPRQSIEVDVAAVVHTLPAVQRVRPGAGKECNNMSLVAPYGFGFSRHRWLAKVADAHQFRRPGIQLSIAWGACALSAMAGAFPSPPCGRWKSPWSVALRSPN